MNKEDQRILDQFDESQGRVRLYRDELQSLTGCIAAVRTLEAEQKNLERVAKLKGYKTWKKIHGGLQLLTKGIVEYTTKVGIRQYKTLENNQGYIQFTTALKPTQYCMDPREYYRLVMAARYGACSHCLDVMTKCDWQRCLLRKTFDCVPCSPGKHERQQYDKDICPYALIDKMEYSEVFGK